MLEQQFNQLSEQVDHWLKDNHLTNDSLSVIKALYALGWLNQLRGTTVTVRSMTSGQRLPASIVKTSRIRRWIGLPYVCLSMLQFGIKGPHLSKGWYFPNAINFEDEVV